MNKLDFAPVLLALADNKFVLGDQLVDIGISAPELQSALAAVAVAQGELGHARHLYHWMNGIRGVTEDVQAESGQSLPVFRNIENWIELMVGVLVLNAAAKTLLEALIRIDEPAVETKAAKMLVEIDEHLVFSGEWCKRFANETGAIPGLYEKAFTYFTDTVESWLAELGKNLPSEAAEAAIEQFRKELTQRCNPEMTLTTS